MKFKLIKLYPQKKNNVESKLAEFEKHFIYPLGNDSFQIDHGTDYFKFFQDLGKPVFYGLTHEDKLVAMGGGILRNIHGKRMWYLCDMKAHPDYKGSGLTKKLFQKVFIPYYYLQCGRGYAISMNPPNKENFVVKIIKNMTWLPIHHYETLYIYQFSYKEFKNSFAKLKELLGPFQIKNNNNKKDIILQSNKEKLNLNHLVFTKSSNIDNRDVVPSDIPNKKGTYMFCLPSKNSQNQLLNEIGIQHSSSASIVGHRMNSDWNFINTSEI